MFLGIWGSVLVGIYLAAWPEVSPLILMFIFILCSLSYKKFWTLGFALLGVLMGLFLFRPIAIEKAELQSGQKVSTTYENLFFLPIERRNALRSVIEAHAGEGFSFTSAREKISKNLDSRDPLLSGLRRALLLGDSKNIPREVWEAMNFFGLSHVLVISGSHLTILLGALGFLLAAFSRRVSVSLPIRRALLLSIPIAVLSLCYVEISILRAAGCFWICFGVGMLFPAVHRYLKSEQLSMIGIAMILFEPALSLDKGYLLSFCCTWVLVRCAELQVRQWECLTTISLAVLALSTVLGIQVSAFASLANVTLLPIFVFFLVPLLFSSSFILEFETFTSNVVRFYFSALQSLKESLQPFDIAAHISSLNATVSLMMVFLILHPKSIGTLRPFFLFISMAVLLIPSNEFVKSTEVILEIFDVGQGDGMRLRSAKHNMFIDGGAHPAQLSAIRAVRSHNSWFFTHYDRDHVGAFQKREPIGLNRADIFVPRLDGSEMSRFLRKWNSLHTIREGVNFSCDAKACLAAWFDSSRDPKKRVQNEDSLVLLLSEKESKKLRIVMLGDLSQIGEWRLLNAIRSQDLRVTPDGIDLLKVGHHGSKTSTSLELLRYLNPRVAIINSGRQNSYGHPHEIVLEKLEMQGVRVFRTDALGNFKVNFDF